MAHGGARKGAGKPKGAVSKIDKAAREQALATGISPLDYMLTQLRDEANPKEARMDAAKAAAPYLHARLAAVEHSGNMTVRHEDALDELDDEGTGDTPPTKG
jgi:hypothetical protein